LKAHVLLSNFHGIKLDLNIFYLKNQKPTLASNLTGHPILENIAAILHDRVVDNKLQSLIRFEAESAFMTFEVIGFIENVVEVQLLP
jgi:hypothetical protein